MNTNQVERISLSKLKKELKQFEKSWINGDSNHAYWLTVYTDFDSDRWRTRFFRLANMVANIHD